MEENNNIEQQVDSMFRDNLNNAQIPAPEGIWESIAQQIPQPITSPSIETLNNTTNSLFTSISTISKIAIIATTAAITGLGVYFITNETKKNDSNELLIEKEGIENDSKISNKTVESINYENEINNPIAKSKENIEQITKSGGNVNNSSSQVNNHTSQNKNLVPSQNNISQNNINPSYIKGENSNKTPIITASPVIRNEENPGAVLSDTIICFTNLFKPNWAFGQTKVLSSQIEIDNKTYTSVDASLLNNSKNKWITIKASLANGDKVERRVKLSNLQLELSITNAAQGAAYCQILNGNLFTHTLWYINNHLLEEEVKHIVYYRNMEFETGTAINLKIVTIDANACKDSLLKDISFFMDELSEPVIPNVITPNNDGLNDKWDIQIKGEVYFNAKVLGNNNSIIFQSNNSDLKWNGLDIHGNIVPEGSYIYIVEYKFPNQKVESKTGYIQLIRN